MTIEELKELHCEVKPCEEDDVEYILERCEESDYAIAPSGEEAQEEQIVRMITDGDRTILGGCIVCPGDWDTAIVDTLWVDERYRGQGMGKALVRDTERVLAEKHCRLVLLATFDFQARPFYEKLGYLPCGIGDWPKGHCNYYLKKRLDALPQQSDPPEESLRFEIRSGSEEDAEFLDRKLREYDDAYITKRPFLDLSRKITDAEGKLIAGVHAEIDDMAAARIIGVWVEESCRGQGLGAYLLRSVEQAAKEENAFPAIADVFDWNANYFLARGYEECVTVEDFPEGHSWHVFRKPL